MMMLSPDMQICRCCRHYCFRFMLLDAFLFLICCEFMRLCYVLFIARAYFSLLLRHMRMLILFCFILFLYTVTRCALSFEVAYMLAALCVLSGVRAAAAARAVTMLDAELPSSFMARCAMPRCACHLRRDKSADFVVARGVRDAVVPPSWHIFFADSLRRMILYAFACAVFRHSFRFRHDASDFYAADDCFMLAPQQRAKGRHFTGRRGVDALFSPRLLFFQIFPRFSSARKIRCRRFFCAAPAHTRHYAAREVSLPLLSDAMARCCFRAAGSAHCF